MKYDNIDALIPTFNASSALSCVISSQVHLVLAFAIIVLAVRIPLKSDNV